MKRIGIVGGLSPESTMLYYKTIIVEYRKRTGDENYPDIIIYSVNFGVFTEFVGRNDRASAVKLLLDALDALKRAGADFAIISANTPHMFIDELEKRSSLPILSIIDALAEELTRDNVKTIGLLGTRYTMKAGFYKSKLQGYGIRVVIPDEEGIDIINSIIYDELVKGVIRKESKDAIIRIIQQPIAKGADGVALACTELPLLIPETTIDGVKVYDTARIHAIKALEKALMPA